MIFVLSKFMQLLTKEPTFNGDFQDAADQI